jgi:hypothetical protein
VRNIAGKIFQVVRPRIADDDGVVQREGTGICPAALQSPLRGVGRNQPSSL